MPDFEPFERVLLTIEYDGSAFYGWQRQAKLRSVQEELERALARATGRETTVWGASRTDAGVNATGQRAHFHNYSTIPAEKFPFVLNTMLPPDVRVTAAPNGTYFTLEKGMMGEPVKKLQQALKSAGYYSGTCDGYYGDATVTAVKNYQRAKGLVQDGKAGPATQRYLYEGDFPDQA